MLYSNRVVHRDLKPENLISLDEEITASVDECLFAIHRYSSSGLDFPLVRSSYNYRMILNENKP